MKSIRNVLALLIFILGVFVAIYGLLHAQEATTPVQTTAPTSVAFSQLLAQGNNVNTSMSPFSGQITNQLFEFETNASEIKTNSALSPSEAFDKLMAAIKQIKGAVNSLETTHNTDRREKANLWFDVLAVIDKNIDTNYGTVNYFKTNQFFINLVPPPDGTNGIVYFSGVAPSALKNPEARAKYEVMLEANREHGDNMKLQKELHNINKQATADVVKFFKSSYTSSEPDKMEFDEILKESALSDVRKQQIKNFFSN